MTDNTTDDEDRDGAQREETYFEIHAEHDGHVNGHRRRAGAENLVESYEDADPAQEYEIKEVAR